MRELGYVGITIGLLFLFLFLPDNVFENLAGQAGEVIIQEVNEEKVYVRANGQTVASLEGGSVEYYHNDYLGSPRVKTDEAGMIASQEEYEPFGEGGEYTGKPKTGTGTVNLGAREYDSSIRRFTTPDNVLSDSMSTYAYVNNNPYSYKDPDGNNPLLILGAAALGGGIGNLAADAWNGEINSVSDGFKSFGQGAAAGVLGAMVVMSLGTGAGALATAGAVEGLALSTVRGDSPGEATMNVAFGAAVGGGLGRLTPGAGQARGPAVMDAPDPQNGFFAGAVVENTHKMPAMGRNPTRVKSVDLTRLSPGTNIRMTTNNYNMEGIPLTYHMTVLDEKTVRIFTMSGSSVDVPIARLETVIDHENGLRTISKGVLSQGGSTTMPLLSSVGGNEGGVLTQADVFMDVAGILEVN